MKKGIVFGFLVLVLGISVLVFASSWPKDYIAKLSSGDCKAIASGDRSWCTTDDCKGIVSNDRSWCKTDDCKGVATKDRSWCRSGLCKAWASKDRSWCDSSDGDCKGIASGDRSWCKSKQCKAIVSKDRSWCNWFYAFIPPPNRSVFGGGGEGSVRQSVVIKRIGLFLLGV